MQDCSQPSNKKRKVTDEDNRAAYAARVTGNFDANENHCFHPNKTVPSVARMDDTENNSPGKKPELVLLRLRLRPSTEREKERERLAQKEREQNEALEKRKRFDQRFLTRPVDGMAALYNKGLRNKMDSLLRGALASNDKMREQIEQEKTAKPYAAALRVLGIKMVLRNIRIKPHRHLTGKTHSKRTSDSC